tara:strand:- start:368 stop:2476 length:2109 start_codon:yes stop_codon:yes gene_type:complete
MNSEKLPEITNEQLKNVFDSLVIATHPVLILENLASFATIIMELWRSLWPKARKRLICNVKWSPSQILADESEFNIVASIASNKLRWIEPYTAISSTGNNNEVSDTRAVKFLLDHQDTILENLLENTSLAIEKPPLQRLRKLSRTVELIDTFNTEPSASLAINLIRNSLSFEDTEGDLDIYVNKALIYLAENLTSLSFMEVEKIQNIVFKKNHNYNLLCLSLASYIENKFTLLKDEDKNRLIADSIRKNRWWYIALKKGISQGVDTLTPSWLQQAKQLIIDEELFAIASDVISDSKDIEKGILELTLENEPNDNDIERLKEFARSKNWAKLYAWCLFRLDQPIMALNKILDFEHPEVVGFDYLIELYNENELLSTFRVIDDTRVITNIENTDTLVENLLPYLELDKKFDRYLLSQGYRSKLSIPSKIIINDGIDSILRSATNGHETYGLIEILAEKSFEENLAERALLQLTEGFSWDKLSKSDTQVLINTVSKYVVENGISNVTDKIIQENIKEKFLKSEIAPKVMDLLIGWNVHVNESEVINILGQYTDNNWRQYGKNLGEFINSSKWISITKALYTLYGNKKVVNNALKYCYSLLPKKQKWAYSFKSKINLDELPDDYLISRLVDEASSLYSSEELEFLWEKAGGKLKDLNSNGNLGKQWTKAIKKAKKGNIEGGVLTLIDIMLERYPYNTELNELKTFF